MNYRKTSSDEKSQKHHALMRLHAGLPRQGPGSDSNTEYALSLLPAFPNPARIYDLGCGPGRATLILANALNQKIVAIDMQEDFLQQLRENADQRGLAHLIETHCGDMSNLSDAAGTIDLIWSEGAIYCVGFDAALKAWRSALTDGGLVACSELSWRVNNPSIEPARFWQKNYPAMRSITQNVLAAEDLGYACLKHFTLPEACWWDEYYTPWIAKIAALKDESSGEAGGEAADRAVDKVTHEAADDAVLRAAVANAESEIDLFRRYDHEYGYEFYILQKTAIKIQRAKLQDSSEIARVFRKSRQATLPFLPPLHTAEEDLRHFVERMLPQNDVYVSKNAENEIVGFVAFKKDWINHLYILPDYIQTGIGSRLLNIAKASSKRLKLWTFQKNENALQFYVKHDFKLVKETDGASNEEKEPDVLFEWVSN